MSGFAHSDVKERVKQATDIVDLVGSYLSLRRQGRNFVAHCPWHDDRRPSLQINPERQTFKCWVCNLGGDVFSFVMQREGVTFPEALAMLAERAGIPLEPRTAARSGGSSGGWAYDPSEAEFDGEPLADELLPVDHRGLGEGATINKPTLLRAMAWAVEQFHRCFLESPEAEPARQYIRERGLTDDSVRTWQIGFAPDDWHWLVNRVRGKASALAALERVGVLGRSANGYYDRFKGRVLFPIKDVQGRPIALGGRILPQFAARSDNDRPPAKYINSPETPLFSKNREFYGLDRARDAIVKAKNVLVMEGYTDCVIAHQCGFNNAVAVLGTALGENHVRRLRFADRCRITLVLDGDDAGRKRANEVLALFVAAQVDLRILTLPDDLDPCDFLLQRGAAEFAPLIESAVDALDHKLVAVMSQLDAADTHAAHLALEDILTTLAASPRVDGSEESSTWLRQQQLLTRLARQFHVAEEDLRSRLTALRRKGQRVRPAGVDRDEQAAIEAARPAAIEIWERTLLELLLLEPEAVPQVAEQIPPHQFASEPARDLYVRCCDLARQGVTPSFDQLMLAIDEVPLKSLLVELDEHAHAQEIADVPQRIRQSLETFRWRQEQQRRRVQRVMLQDQRLDPQEELQVLQDLLQRERARQGLSQPAEE